DAARLPRAGEGVAAAVLRQAGVCDVRRKKCHGQMSIWSKYSTTLSSPSSKATEGLKRRGAQLTRCLASSRGSACRSITDRNTVFPNTGHASRAAQPAPSRNSTPHSKRVTQPPEPSQLLVNFWPERSLEQQLMSARLTATIRYSLQSRATRRCSTPISPSSPLSLPGPMSQVLEMAARKVCLPSSRDVRSLAYGRALLQ